MRPVFGTHRVAVTPSLKALLRSVSMTLHLWAWLQCRLRRSCLEVAVGSRRVLQNLDSHLCRDDPPILPYVFVFSFQSFHPTFLLLENLMFISPNNFSNRRYITLFGRTRFLLFQAGKELETSKRIVGHVHPESYTQMMRGNWCIYGTKTDACLS